MMPKAFLRVKSVLLIIGVLICTIAKSQQIHQFTSALAVRPGYNYGREAVYTDKLAYLLYNGKLDLPREGNSYDGSSGDSNYVWRSVTADSLNRLFLRGRRRDFLRGGGNYFYLTYQSAKEGAAVINIKGSSAFLLNGEPHAGDPYSSGWLEIPVKLKKGLNELFVRGYAITATLTIPEKPVYLATEDVTAPSVIVGQDKTELTGGIVVVNATDKQLTGLKINTSTGNSESKMDVPAIPAYSIRKVPFSLSPAGVTTAGEVTYEIALKQNGRIIDTALVKTMP